MYADLGVASTGGHRARPRARGRRARPGGRPERCRGRPVLIRLQLIFRELVPIAFRAAARAPTNRISTRWNLVGHTAVGFRRTDAK